MGRRVQDVRLLGVVVLVGLLTQASADEAQPLKLNQESTAASSATSLQFRDLIKTGRDRPLSTLNGFLFFFAGALAASVGLFTLSRFVGKEALESGGVNESSRLLEASKQPLAAKEGAIEEGSC